MRLHQVLTKIVVVHVQVNGQWYNSSELLPVQNKIPYHCDDMLCDDSSNDSFPFYIDYYKLTLINLNILMLFCTNCLIGTQ